MAITTYPGEIISTNLSLALSLVDEFTQGKPVGAVTIIIKENGVRATQNLSGYYLFTDLAKAIYTVRVEADYYSTIEKSIDTFALDAKNPVAEILLKPIARYPFPGSATLLRGVVASSAPVSGANVTVTGKAITTFTDAHGEFVLYFKGIKSETITVIVQKGADSKSITATIEEWKTVSTGVIHFP